MSTAKPTRDVNATAIREFNAAIFDDHDLDAIEAYLSPDVVHYQAGVEVARGFDGSREYFESILTAFPDIDLTVVDLVADDDSAIFRFEATGTHEGDLGMAGGDGEMAVVEPTGKRASWQGFVAGQFEDGKLVETTILSDQFGLAKQLGVIPSA